MPIVFQFPDLFNAQGAPINANTTADSVETDQKLIQFDALFAETHVDLRLPAFDLDAEPDHSTLSSTIHTDQQKANGIVEEVSLETLATILNVPLEELKSTIADIAYDPPLATVVLPPNEHTEKFPLKSVQYLPAENAFLLTPTSNKSHTDKNVELSTNITFKGDPNSETKLSDPKIVQNTTRDDLKPPTRVRVTAMNDSGGLTPSQDAITKTVPAAKVIPSDPMTRIKQENKVAFEIHDTTTDPDVEWVAKNRVVARASGPEMTHLPAQSVKNNILTPAFGVSIDTGATDTNESVTALPSSASTTPPDQAFQRTANVPIPQQILRNLPQVEIAQPQQYEIELSPRELGHVKIIMIPTDTNMNVLISCERDETSILLRKNLDELTQDMHEIGYSNVNIEFGENSQNSSNEQRFGSQNHNQNSEQTTTPSSRIQVMHGSGVDLKI